MQLKVHLTGRSGLVMHNGRLADPLDPIAQQIGQLTDKPGSKRTPIEEEQIADLEWRGALYWDSQDGLIMPAANVVRCLRDAATAWQLGESVYRAVSPLAEHFPVVHNGPKTIDGLAKRDEHRWRTTVKIGRNRTARTRPIFRDWSLDFEFDLDDTELSSEDLDRILERAGRLTGLGEARKLGYGRFTATVAA